jgi:hypothetical protein
MATASSSTLVDASTLANFNAWANWIYSQFIAFGWTQTSDTGQGAFPAVGSVPTAAGYYAIFKSADTLTASCPIYVKLEVWAASSVPTFAITVGTAGTNGAGTLLAPATTRFTWAANGASTTNSIAVYASGDAGSIRFNLWSSTLGTSPDYYQAIHICIARSRDTSGNQTGNYVQLWCGGSSSNRFSQTVYAPGQGTTNSGDSTTNSYIAAVPMTGNTVSWSNNGAICVSPVQQNIGGLSNPTPDILVAGYADVKPGTSVNVTVYGVSHTYVACGCNQFYAWILSAACSLLLRYE